MATPQIGQSATFAQQLADGALPPLPAIPDASWAPSATSDPVAFPAPAQRRLLHANSDNSGKAAMVPDTPGAKDPSTPAVLRDYWDGRPGPAEYTVTLKEYWRLVPGTYTHVMQGGGYTESYSVTDGIAITDSQSLTAELGVDVDGLSAKITAMFSQSVTTTSDRTYIRSYSVGSPPEGMTRVWMLWQLVHDIDTLGTNGQLIAPEQGEGNVFWYGPEHSISGAYLSYGAVHVSIPAPLYVPTQADFPAA